LAKEQPLVLVLGGGNALGSYLAGACEHLLQQAIEPQWIVGGSIGAVMGGIIAGNAPEDRLPRLKAFWDEAMIRSPGLMGRGTKTRHAYRDAARRPGTPITSFTRSRHFCSDGRGCSAIAFPGRCPCCPGCRMTLRSTTTHLCVRRWNGSSISTG
jgi:predicted acylesterase/phospholipase RssA